VKLDAEGGLARGGATLAGFGIGTFRPTAATAWGWRVRRLKPGEVGVVRGFWEFRTFGRFGCFGFFGFFGFWAFFDVWGVADGSGDGFDEVADAFLFGDFDAEVTGLVEEFSEVAAHVRYECADDLVRADARLADTLADVALDAFAVEGLVGGLVESIGFVSGGGSGLGAVASIANEFIDEHLLSVGELGLAGGWVGFSFGHV